MSKRSKASCHEPRENDQSPVLRYGRVAGLGIAGIVVGAGLIWVQTEISSPWLGTIMVTTGIALVFTGLLTLIALFVAWAHSLLD